MAQLNDKLYQIIMDHVHINILSENVKFICTKSDKLFLACFTASTNKFDLYQQYIRG